MSLSGAGNGSFGKLGLPIKENNVETEIPFDVRGIQSISAGNSHSIIIKDYKVFAAGSDNDFGIGGYQLKIYETFTEIKITNKKIISSACGDGFSIYLTIDGCVIYCSSEAKGKRIVVDFGKKAISVFSGNSRCGIIGEEGAIHLIDPYQPNKKPYDMTYRFYLGSPCIDLVCCRDFTCAINVEGEIFMKKKDSNNFSSVSSLSDIKMKKITGYWNTCCALTMDGRAFIYGKNDFGQFGNGTTRDNFENFEELLIPTQSKIKDVSCSNHTLILTENDELYGCGHNYYYQLLVETKERYVLKPIKIFEGRNISTIVTGLCHTFIITGIDPIINNSCSFFKNTINPRKPAQISLNNPAVEHKQIENSTNQE